MSVPSLMVMVTEWGHGDGCARGQLPGSALSPHSFPTPYLAFHSGGRISFS